MIEVWVVWSPLIYDMTPKYVVGWLGWTWVDLIFDPSCMVIFKSSVSDFINKEFSNQSPMLSCTMHTYWFQELSLQSEEVHSMH